jgi:serine/threonine protein kinase
MLRNNLGVIDIENMSEAERFVVGTFLNKHRPTLLKKSTTYSITESDIIFQFSFADNLLLRARKADKEGFRYEVIDKKLGAGANGTVYLSRGTLQTNSSIALFKQKPRAVKELYDDTEADIEYNYSILAPHLHAKPLTKADSVRFTHLKGETSYLTEAFMPGDNLYEVIDEEYNAPRYTTDERIQLSINILTAIQDQVHSIGLIHRDIKPENIMIDQLSAKVIDYRYCKKAGDTYIKSDPGGTPLTSPPEQFAHSPTELQTYTLKSDSYAAGKTLSELWRAIAEANSIKASTRLQEYQTFFSYAQKDTQYKYHKFLTGDLTSEHAAQIKNMFEQLSRAKPEDRWTIDQAISCLNQIQQERLANTVNKNLRSSKQ